MTSRKQHNTWAGPKFLPHTIYKSYDPAWLRNHDFERMTRWMQLLTSVDLGNPAQMPVFATIDGWLDWLDAEKGLDVTHSTGTAGRLSFIPRAKAEVEARHEKFMQGFCQWWSEMGLPVDDAMQFHFVWAGAADGRAALQKSAALWRKFRLPAPDAHAALFDYDLGADYEFYVVEARAARENGRLRLDRPSPYVEKRLAEAERRHSDMPYYLGRLLDEIDTKMRGQRTVVMGGIHAVAALADAALARGMEGIFGPHSLHYTAGGLKGRGAPTDFAVKMRRFIGTDLAFEAYGMSEMNTGLLTCRAGRFHAPEWLDVTVLDPTSNWQVLPRSGDQEGRGAYVDHSVTSCPSGLASSDHIKISYVPCVCGRLTPHVSPDIKRVQDRNRDSDFVPAPRDDLDAFIAKMMQFTRC